MQYHISDIIRPWLILSILKVMHMGWGRELGKGMMSMVVRVELLSGGWLTQQGIINVRSA